MQPITVIASQAAAFKFLSPWQFVTVSVNGHVITPENDGGGVFTIPAADWTNSSGGPMQAVLAQTVPAILAPAADAYVRGGVFADDNYGSDVVLWVKNDPSASVDRQAYLRFDLTGITAPIQSAILTLTPVYEGTDTASLALGVSLLPDASDDWGQSTLTWNNRPQGAGTVDTISGSQLSVGQPVSLDVTSLIEQAWNVNGLASFQITATSAPDAAAYVEFASSNNGTVAWRPTLSVITDSAASGTVVGGTTISGGTVTLAGGQSLGSANAPLTIQNGGTLDLGQNSQTVGAVTLTDGTLADGSLNAAAYDVLQGAISANLGGQAAALVKSGSGTVVLNGANSYQGGTIVLAGTLVIANPLALPDGGGLVVGSGGVLVFAGLAFEKQQGSTAAAAASLSIDPVLAATNAALATAATAIVPDVAQVSSLESSTRAGYLVRDSVFSHPIVSDRAAGPGDRAGPAVQAAGPEPVPISLPAFDPVWPSGDSSKPKKTVLPRNLPAFLAVFDQY